MSVSGQVMACRYCEGQSPNDDDCTCPANGCYRTAICPKIVGYRDDIEDGVETDEDGWEESGDDESRGGDSSGGDEY